MPSATLDKKIQTASPHSLLLGANRHIQGITSKPEDVKLKGEEFRAVVSDRIVMPGIQVSRAIDGASTLTIPVDDPDAELWRHPILQEAFTLDLDGLSFTFVGARPEGDTLTLTLESTPVYRLRHLKGPGPKVYRGKWTRAEFAARLVAELKRPKVPFYSPELHVKQPIKDSPDALAQSNTNREQGLGDQSVKESGQGLDKGARLTVKGIPANSEQLRNGDIVLRVGASLGADARTLASAIVSGIQENNMTNADAGPGCRGFFCIIDSTAAALDFNPLDLPKAAESYFKDGFGGPPGAIDYAKQNPGASPGEISSAIEGNAAGASDRVQWNDEAMEWVRAFGGGTLAGVGSTLSVTETKRYPFAVENGEDYWTALQRLGDEVNWRRFESAGIIYFIAETALLRSRLRMIVEREADGVNSIQPVYDVGKKVTEVTVECRAKTWAAPPGSVIFLRNEGPATGRYLVSQIDSYLSNEDATITLKAPTYPLPEPASETTTKSVSIGSGLSTGSGSDAYQAMVEKAREIDAAKKPYVWGGGHSSFDSPSGYDCSGAVSAVLGAGGFLDAPLSTTGLQSFGESGEGELVTVYVRETGNPRESHTIIDLGGDVGFFGTSGTNPGGGAGFFDKPSDSYLSTLPIRRHPRGL